jgi:hypothetical protein
MSVVTDHRVRIDYLNTDIRRICSASGRIEKKTLRIRDLENATLCVVPEKYLEVAVLVSRIFRRDVAS